jgi:hypothetical protein
MPNRARSSAGRIRELVSNWPNPTETTVSGTHFIREDSPDEIGTAVAEFVRKLRPKQAAVCTTSTVRLTKTADLQFICARSQ